MIAESLRERTFAPGEALLRGGERAASMHLVVEGRVAISRGGRRLSTVGPGAPVGGLSILARETEGVEAVAETEVVTLQTDADDVFEIFEEHFGMLRHVLAALARQLLEVMSRLPAEAIRGSLRSVTPAREEGLDLVERILFLRQTQPFAHSSVNALAELAQGLDEVRFEAGHVLWREGEEAARVILIVSGRVQCTSSHFPALTLGPGSSPGAVEAVAAGPRRYTAVAETPVVALSGHVEGLFDVFEDNFDMALDYLATIAGWLLTLIEAVAAHGGDSSIGDVLVAEPPPQTRR